MRSKDLLIARMVSLFTHFYLELYKVMQEENCKFQTNVTEQLERKELWGSLCELLWCDCAALLCVTQLFVECWNCARRVVALHAGVIVENMRTLEPVWYPMMSVTKRVPPLHHSG